MNYKTKCTKCYFKSHHPIGAFLGCKCPYCNHPLAELGLTPTHTRADYTPEDPGDLDVTTMHIDDLVEAWDALATPIEETQESIQEQIDQLRKELINTKMSDIVGIQRLNTKIKELEGKLND